jgi:hypothetical protein
MTGNVIEIVMGAVVLVVAALFLFFAYTTSQVRAVQGYRLTAHSTASTGRRSGRASWRRSSVHQNRQFDDFGRGGAPA